MTISLRLNPEDAILIKKFAEIKNLTVSELVRSAVMERIEDEIDLQSYNKSMAEYRKNPTSYTLEEVERELQL